MRAIARDVLPRVEHDAPNNTISQLLGAYAEATTL
jgi:hypothetical protein